LREEGSSLKATLGKKLETHSPSQPIAAYGDTSLIPDSQKAYIGGYLSRLVQAKT
jgi:uncharacterized protein YueI